MIGGATFAGVFISGAGLVAIAGFALATSLISVIGLTSTMGLALAKDFVLTAGFISATGLAAATDLVVVLDLAFATALILAAGAGFSTFATLRIFFTAAFFGAFLDPAFTAFARGLAAAEVARRESGFAAVIFFGFFIATVLAMGCAFAFGD